ncbi:P-loop containing nucleoside triphosphate hydrolase protein [Lophium mytilinum]|uniref:P-loop containing nucleoside triphosphate hydrolase protein n=1 Tax=Lophium mytilinum TaxID=390894 RepID=A0A6A6RAZ3_9PEZI|nr:P-loop containing nucleoside triphosphate hydrolase protein [Lophium mytilinum]
MRILRSHASRLPLRDMSVKLRCSSALASGSILNFPRNSHFLRILDRRDTPLGRTWRGSRALHCSPTLQRGSTAWKKEQRLKDREALHGGDARLESASAPDERATQTIPRNPYVRSIFDILDSENKSLSDQLDVETAKKITELKVLNFLRNGTILQEWSPDAGAPSALSPLYPEAPQMLFHGPFVDWEALTGGAMVASNSRASTSPKTSRLGSWNVSCTIGEKKIDVHFNPHILFTCWWRFTRPMWVSASYVLAILHSREVLRSIFPSERRLSSLREVNVTSHTGSRSPSIQDGDHSSNELSEDWTTNWLKSLGMYSLTDVIKHLQWVDILDLSREDLLELGVTDKKERSRMVKTFERLKVSRTNVQSTPQYPSIMGASEGVGIWSSIQLPTRMEYPSVPRAIFSPILAARRGWKRLSGGRLSAGTGKSEETVKHGVRHCTHTLSCQLADGTELIGLGNATTFEAAKGYAELHVWSQLHTLGIIPTLFPNTDELSHEPRLPSDPGLISSFGAPTLLFSKEPDPKFPEPAHQTCEHQTPVYFAETVTPVNQEREQSVSDAKNHDVGSIIIESSPSKLDEAFNLFQRLNSVSRKPLICVYIYCAKLGEIPIVQVQKSGHLVECRITIPEQNFEVVSYGSTFTVAAKNAAVSFVEQIKTKARTEAYDAIDKELFMINSTNAPGLTRLLQSHDLAGLYYQSSMIPVQLGGGWESQALIEGQPVAPAVHCYRRDWAENLARLAVLVASAKSQPDFEHSSLYTSLGNRSFASLKIPDEEITEGSESEQIELDQVVSDETLSDKIVSDKEVIAADSLQLLDKLEDSKALASANAEPQVSQLGDEDIPMSCPVGKDASAAMSDAAKDVSALGSNIDSLISLRNEYSTSYGNEVLSPKAATTRNSILKTREARSRSDPSRSELISKQMRLPIRSYRDALLQLIDDNAYSIVVGATGSGKTTQVPQILLEDAIAKGFACAANIVCTQPRRIAATSVANRVAKERNEPLMDTVGYQVRHDARLPQPGGSITYCTVGILLKQLQQAPDATLDSLSHIIIDEVHDRDLLTDFTLATLKTALEKRRLAKNTCPKVIVMSATLNIELFSNYLMQPGPTGKLEPCPWLMVPGRTYPVTENHLEDLLAELSDNYPREELSLISEDKQLKQYVDAELGLGKVSAEEIPATEDESGEVENLEESTTPKVNKELTSSATNAQETSKDLSQRVVPTILIAATIAHIAMSNKPGSILVFLPGMFDIMNVKKALGKCPLGVDFSDRSRYRIVILHSTLRESQNEVFDSVPRGVRKIVLATNIAETSITIPDIQFVVDSGKAQEMHYNQANRVTSLEPTWISRSNCKQRAGRAGRVSEGVYYAMFSRARLDSMRNTASSELQRSDLQETCLTLKAHSPTTSIQEFLTRAIEPPSPSNVANAIQELQLLGALTKEEALTPLGSILSRLPIHPSLAKMIVLGIVFRCLPAMIVISASANENLFNAFTDAEKAQRKENFEAFSIHSHSDHIARLTLLRIGLKIREERGETGLDEFAKEYFLRRSILASVYQTMDQIYTILINSGIMPPPSTEEDPETQDLFPDLNENSNKQALIKALVLAGFQQNVAATRGKGHIVRYAHQGEAFITGDSVNKLPRSMRTKAPHFQTLVYSSLHELAESKGRKCLRQTSVISPLVAALFGSSLERKGSLLMVNGWLHLRIVGEEGEADEGLAERVVGFRRGLERVLSSAYLSMAQRQATGQPYTIDSTRDAFIDKAIDLLCYKDESQHVEDVKEDEEQHLEISKEQAEALGWMDESE